MVNDRTSDEEPRTDETSEPVPEVDALEQAAEIAPEEEDDLPSKDDDVPEEGCGPIESSPWVRTTSTVSVGSG